MRSTFVPEPAPAGDERGFVAVFGSEWDTVKTILGIRHCLVRVVWDSGRCPERRFCVVRLPGTSIVETLEIDGPAWFAVMLSDHHHPGAPGLWRVEGDPLQDTFIHVCR